MSASRSERAAALPNAICRLQSSEAATILADLQRRDHIDSSREVAPLRIPDDAVVISSEGRQFEETVAEVARIIRARERQARRDR